MADKILITGGAGFIGSHLADELLNHGYQVRALDSLTAQVHGPERKRPGYLNREVELIIGDLRDRAAVRKALQGVNAVYHFAAMVGVGQSMYEISSYTSVNNFGTSVLLEEITRRSIERLIVASSMSIYGEGLYCSPDGKVCHAAERSLSQFEQGDWELRNEAGEVLTPLPTPENKSPSLASVYALSKYDQERMSIIVGRAYGIPVTALRFFNVFGTRQALSNPYTGVLAIFASRYLNRKPPLIYEDGYQKRDFVHVYDVARACRLALKVPEAGGRVFNIASGCQYSILEIAARLGKVMAMEGLDPVITGKYRVGDIRHCFADISQARSILGFSPSVTLDEGLGELSTWLDGKVAIDYVNKASLELSIRGLTVGLGQ